jgi:5'-methylthioadenosine phosphorylase
MTTTIGIIGGSGLYSMPGFEAQEERRIDTPFGAPSDNYIRGELEGHDVVFSGHPVWGSCD